MSLSEVILDKNQVLQMEGHCRHPPPPPPPPKSILLKNQLEPKDNRQSYIKPGLPRSGKNIWKMEFFPGQGKVREFCGWPGKFRMDLESQGICKYMAMAGSLQKI